MGPPLDPTLLANVVAEHPAGATVAVRVVPRARRTEIVGGHGRALKIRVQAPPVDGAANAAVLACLADAIGVRSSVLEVLRGGRGRDKVVLVRGVEPRQVRAALAARTATET